MQMMKCKAALTEANGDMEKAVEILRKRTRTPSGQGRQPRDGRGPHRRLHRPGQEGRRIVEVRCEAHPSAKSDLFIKLANDLAKQVALKRRRSVRGAAGPAVRRRPEQDRQRAHRRGGRPHAREHEAGPLRADDRRLSAATSITTARSACWCRSREPRRDAQLLRDVCMHITAKNPLAGRSRRRRRPTRSPRRRRSPGARSRRPRTKASRPTSSRRSPRARCKTWFAENVLVEQPFVKDDSKTVGDLLKSDGLKLVKFARLRVGEVGS